MLLLLLTFWLGYNGLVKRRNQVDNAWSQIDVQLKRRHDLIPNLVETVKGYAAHERGTFEAVAYPDLKANQNFLNLQEELTSAEDRVAYARQFYNDSVLSYNTQIQKFPTVLLAGMFHFEKREFFDAAPEDTETPQVQF